MPIILTPLKQISHPKGDIYHALKKSDAGYRAFGEAYFTTVHQDDVKGWKKHTVMTLNLVVPVGAVEFVVHDMQTGAFESVTLSQANYQRLTVPPGLWVAFRGVGPELNLVLNIADIEHDPEEAENRPLESIDYAW